MGYTLTLRGSPEIVVVHEIVDGGRALNLDDGSGRLDTLTCLEVGSPHSLHIGGNGIAALHLATGSSLLRGASVFSPALVLVLGKAELLHVGTCTEALGADVNLELLSKVSSAAENAEVLHGTGVEVSGSIHAFFRVSTAEASSGHVVESLLLRDELGGARSFPELRHLASPASDLCGCLLKVTINSFDVILGTLHVFLGLA